MLLVGRFEINQRAKDKNSSFEAEENTVTQKKKVANIEVSYGR